MQLYTFETFHYFWLSEGIALCIVQRLCFNNCIQFSSVQFSRVTQLCPTFCDPMNYSAAGLPVQHQPEFTQTHVHQVSDAIQPSHPLSSPSSPAPNLSQHQSLFQ